jgi:hypothetical protein
MPVNQAVKEGELMAAAAAEDAAKLTAVGLDSNCITELDLSVGALRYAEAAVLSHKKNHIACHTMCRE